MPKPSVWMIRLSLVYLLLSFLAGAIILLHKAVPLHNAIWALLPIHIEMAFFGWVLQLTMGTAYWIFPRFLEGHRRGDPRWVWPMVLLMNSGILLTIVSTAGILSDHWMVTGRIFEILAVLLFILLHWQRVVTYKNLH
jgi:membrane-bound acyltransferase YfiQ involved in biofilm formation